VTIRPISHIDIDRTYALAFGTPELRVSSSFGFMDSDEFRAALLDSSSVSLCAADEGSVIGFIHASTRDLDLALEKHWACIVYLAVSPDFRHRGYARQLLAACLQELRRRGITHVYGWARAGGPIIPFLSAGGFSVGHEYVWMDAAL